MCRSLQLKRYNSNNSYQLWAAGWSWRQNFPILKSNLRVKIPLIDRYLRFGQQTGMLQNCLHFNKFYSLTFARKLGTLFIWSLFSVKLLRDKIAFGTFRYWNLKRQKDLNTYSPTHYRFPQSISMFTNLLHPPCGVATAAKMLQLLCKPNTSFHRFSYHKSNANVLHYHTLNGCVVVVVVEGEKPYQFASSSSSGSVAGVFPSSR